LTRRRTWAYIITSGVLLTLALLLIAQEVPVFVKPVGAILCPAHSGKRDVKDASMQHHRYPSHLPQTVGWNVQCYDDEGRRSGGPEMLTTVGVFFAVYIPINIALCWLIAIGVRRLRADPGSSKSSLE
jgi:hypothetical protein